MLVFKAELMYVPKPVGGARGGGVFAPPHALRLSQKKKLSPCTTCPQRAHTPVVHRVDKIVAQPSWGAPPETWVMEVVEMREVQKGGLIVLVQGTIKVVVISAAHVACHTRSFPCALQQSV